jgi:fibronectin-binding autotransporter adhesin
VGGGTGGNLIVSEGRFGIGGNAPVPWDGYIDLRPGTALFNAGCACAELSNQIVVNDAVIDANGAGFILSGMISGGDLTFQSSSAAGVIELRAINDYGASTIGANNHPGPGPERRQRHFRPRPRDAGGPDQPDNLSRQSERLEPLRRRRHDRQVRGRDAGFTGFGEAGADFTGDVVIAEGGVAFEGAFGDLTGNSARLLLGEGDHSERQRRLPRRCAVLRRGEAHAGSSPGTLTIGGDMLLTSGTVIDFELGEAGVVGGANNDLVLVGGNLTLDGILNVAGFGPGYGAGYYRLFNYGGSLTDNGLALGTIEGGLQPACSPTLRAR